MNAKWWIVALVFVVAHSVAAADAQARRFPLPGHGELELSVPMGWKVAVTSSGRELPPTLHFTAADGQAFEFIVTPLWQMQGLAPPSDPQTVRERVGETAQQAQSQATESRIEVKELKGTNS